jgi:putative peptide zinc metalloprotease protein
MGVDSDSIVSLSAPAAYIKALPCFSMLTQAEAEALATHCTPQQFEINQTIVVEDDLVDKVYIITEGHAEVAHLVSKKKLGKERLITMPLAIIGDGDAIGLNDTGFFSDTGRRTATVIAVSPVSVLAIDLKSLHQFLQEHPSLKTAMLDKTKQLLRIQLIKQSLPFVRLSAERTAWLAEQIVEETVIAGSDIFKQGDAGDKCYLIRSGQVEIIRTEEDQSERRLATLKSPTLFGEATMITHAPRNATARAKTDCELLVLQHQYLSELIESEENVANMFMTLMVDRSRPSQNPRVSPHNRTTADGQEIVILKNPDNGKYFKLSPEGWFVWEQLNGKQTMPAITMALAEKFNLFSPDVVAAIISKLANDGFIEHVDIVKSVSRTQKTFWGRMITKARAMLEFRYAFGDADKWLTKMYSKVVYLLFTRIGKLILAGIAITGLTAFFTSTSDTIATFNLMPDVWLLLIPLVPATLLSVALHELGHAFATKAYGYEVHYMGVGWFWVGPVAFTDTSDMWLSTRGPRTVVNLAGCYTDCLVAGICSLLVLVIANPYVTGFLWIFALYTYINAFRMLSPLQELDGYYVLMDLVDKPHLRQAAVLWLIKGFPKALRKPSLFKQNKPEIIYWLACIVFLILVSIMTLLVQDFVLKIFGLHASNPLISLSLPFLVAIISGLGLIADVRNQNNSL